MSWQDLNRAPGVKSRGRFGRAPYQRSPDRARSKQRRQMLAATAPMPPRMMAQLTPSQQAYARFIVDETLRFGDCSLCLDAIAARCGMSSKTAQRAQQRLAELGWIAVQHRPRHGQKHDTNIVTITAEEWILWVKFAKKPRNIGGHLCLATDNPSFLNGFIRDLEGLRNPPRPPDKLSPELEASFRRLQAAMRSEKGGSSVPCSA